MTPKKLYQIALFVLSQTLLFSVFAAVEQPFEVGTWAHFCKGAVTHTFDDNTQGQTTIAQPLFDAKDFHMTLFTVTGSMNPLWSNLKNAFAKGHEIASHSVTHPGTMGDAECPTSQSTIKQQIPGEMCVTIAYPNCNIPTTQTELKKCYIGGRICNGQIVNKSPADFYRIGSIISGSAGINTVDALNSKANDAVSQNGWCVYLHHGVGNDGHGYSNTPTAVMQGNLDYLYQNRDKIWTESFGTVIRYIKERDAVSLSIKSSDNNSIIVTITDTLPNSIFNYPLSFRRPLPANWTDPVVTQKGVTLKDTIVTVNNSKYVMFEAVPDGGDVEIRNQAVAVLRYDSPISGHCSVFAQRNASLVIDRQQFCSAELSVTIFSVTGKTLGHYNLANGESRIALPLAKINRSACIVTIAGGGKTFAKTLMPPM